jgi:hypothetical protein
VSACGFSKVFLEVGDSFLFGSMFPLALGDVCHFDVILLIRGWNLVEVVGAQGWDHHAVCCPVLLATIVL